MMLRLNGVFGLLLVSTTELTFVFGTNCTGSHVFQNIF